MTEGTALVPTSNVEAYRASTEAATICKDIVVATAKNIQGRKFVPVEGWQAIAVAHGCTASARDVERVSGGYRAIGEIRRMSDGAVISAAEGFVGEDEAVWFGGTDKGKTYTKRLDYAIRAMAQTRAISRACRSAFAHVVVMMNAGLSTTPAEEMNASDVIEGEFTEGAPDRRSAEGRIRDDTAPQERQQAAQGQRKPGPTSAELRREGAWERYMGEMNAQRGVDELRAWAKKVWPVIKTWPRKWVDAFKDAYDKRGAELVAAAKQKAAGAAPATEDEGPSA